MRTVRYGYDAVGNRTTLEQANGVITTTTYDQRNRLKQLLTRTAAGVLLFGATYEVDASGARTAIAEFDARGPTRSVSYAYDGTKRLVAETIARPGQADRTTSYVYDAVGNRLRRTNAGVITTYVLDANDRLSTETTGGVPSRPPFSEGEGVEREQRVFTAQPQPSRPLQRRGGSKESAGSDRTFRNSLTTTLRVNAECKCRALDRQAKGGGVQIRPGCPAPAYNYLHII